MTKSNIKYRLPRLSTAYVAALVAAVVGLAAVPGRAQREVPYAARPGAATEVPESAMGPRFSAALRGEPLQRLLQLVENTTSTRFRYGAPVDTLVTETFDNAPLWPALEALLLKSGFHMRRSGDSAFLFRNHTPPAPAVPARSTPPKGASRETARATPRRVLPVPATITPAAWQYWALSSPPPDDWVEVQPTPRPPVLVQGTSLSHGWRDAELAVASDKSPGVSVLLPPTASTRYLRWPMKLRDIPLGAQLVVETSAAATFYVNGAPMFRRRSGRQSLDLSEVLRIGDNCLALQWEPPARPEGADSSGVARPAPPTLHYEWFFSERNK